MPAYEKPAPGAGGRHRPLGRLREIGLQVAAGVAVAALVLAGIELALALLSATRDAPVWSPLDLGGDEVARAVRFVNASLIPTKQDPDLLWRNRARGEKVNPVYPRAGGSDETWTVRINSEGFRGSERRYRDDSDDVYRILLVGDASTFGYNVEEYATFASRLELELRLRFSPHKVECINAGVAGWSWAQGRRFIEREGLRLNPDLIVVAHGTDDQFWNARSTDSELMWLLERPILRTVFDVNAWALQTYTYRAILALMPPPQQAHVSPGCETQIAETGACHRVSLQEIERSIHAVHEATTAAGIDLLVMNADFLGTPATQAIRDAVHHDGIPFLDLVQQFTKVKMWADIRLASSLHLFLGQMPTIRLRNPAAGETPRPPRLVFRVFSLEGGALSIRAGTYPDSGLEVKQDMYDDGTHGDEVAHDGVFSTTIEAFGGQGALAYQYDRDGKPEFESRPPYPSSWTKRLIRFADDGVTPIDTFGQRLLMADNVHPNAAGHTVIATSVLAAMEPMPSFRSAFGSPEQPAPSPRSTAAPP